MENKMYPASSLHLLFHVHVYFRPIINFHLSMHWLHALHARFYGIWDCSKRHGWCRATLASSSEPASSGRGPSFQPREDIHIDLRIRNGVNSICISIKLAFVTYSIFRYAFTNRRALSNDGKIFDCMTKSFNSRSIFRAVPFKNMACLVVQGQRCIPHVSMKGFSVALVFGLTCLWTSLADSTYGSEC